MGYNVYFYVGPYIKAYPPGEEYTLTMYTCTKEECPNHGRGLSDSKFCSICGSPTGRCGVKRKQPLNMRAFLDKHLGNENMFSVVYQEDISSQDKKPFCLIIPNNEKQGGLLKDENDAGEYSLPNLDQDFYKHGDWKLLWDRLYEKQISIEEKIGCIIYSR
jgi:hypothetical protein